VRVIHSIRGVSSQSTTKMRATVRRRQAWQKWPAVTLGTRRCDDSRMVAFARGFEFAEPIARYVECFHARNGLSRDRTAPEAAAELDAALHTLVTPFTKDGEVELHIRGRVVCGKPLPGKTLAR